MGKEKSGELEPESLACLQVAGVLGPGKGP